jgi:hypothetical protein
MISAFSLGLLLKDCYTDLSQSLGQYGKLPLLVMSLGAGQ